MNASDWISCADRMPTGNGKYLVTDGIESCIAWCRKETGKFYDSDGWRYFIPLDNVTHWMELPKLPKKEE